MSTYSEINKRTFRHKLMLLLAVMLYVVGLGLIANGSKGYGAAAFGGGVLVYGYAVIYSQQTASMFNQQRPRSEYPRDQA